MNSSDNMKDSALTKLDIVGNEEILRLPTTIAVCYSIPDEVSDSHIINTLQHGMNKIAFAFPWIAGKVVQVDSKNGKPMFAIRHGKHIPFIVKNLRNDSTIPSMDELKKDGFSNASGVFAEKLITPSSLIVEPNDDIESVLIIQVNFIKGGLILGVSTQHQATDMGGMYYILRLLSQACHNIPFTEEQLATGNLDRENIIPLLDMSALAAMAPTSNDSESTPPLSDDSTASDSEDSQDFTSVSHRGPYTRPNVFFKITKDSAAQLKADASKDISNGFISTDDAITALISKSVARARLSHVTSETRTGLTRYVDVRPHLNLPASYPGLAVFMNKVDTDVKTLISESIGTLAEKFRQIIQPDLVLGVMSGMATAIASGLLAVKDFEAFGDTTTNFLVTSWAKFNFYDLDFDLGLGKPLAFRRPVTARCVVDSLGWILPKAPNGDYDLSIVIREEDLESLKKDEEFMKYVLAV